MNIGIAGTGKMGSAMAARLLAQGHQVTVWNRTAARAAPVLALGARWAASPRELPAGADAVISMLTDDGQLTLMLLLPAMLMMSAMFFTSCYFSFRDCFVSEPVLA